jgi:nucleotide-binding universal stress UspA family protein
MKNFKINKILIPLDFSDNSMMAVEHGQFMAKLFKADIVLAHIIESKVLRIDLGKFSSSEKKSAGEIVQAKINEIATELKVKTGGKITTVIKTGKIAANIVETAKETNADMIIMGTHGVSGVEEFFIGSNAFRVVTESHCPVLTVQTHKKKLGFERILMPIDLSSSSTDKVRYVMQLAKKYNSRVNILGILATDDEDEAVRLERLMEQVEKYLDKNDVDFDSQIVEGKNLAETTLKHAKKQKVDLIAIMTEQEENFTGIFLGPFAQQVVNHSKIPVLSVKPDQKGTSMSFFH